jgi:UDP-glucose 4-epimerase
MKWLITGGCGFIGTNLVQRVLAESTHSIRVLDNLSVGTRDALAGISDYEEITPETEDSTNASLELLVGDVQNPEIVSSAVKGVDIIVHLAANTGVGPSVENPRNDCLVNVLGTFNCLEAARHQGVKRFIFASSGAPIGEEEPPIHEELAAHPVSPYGASKLAGEGYCSAYWATFGVETVALRFGNVYGPASKHKSSVVAKFLKDALTTRSLEVYGDGTQTRDFIFIDDLIDAIHKAATVSGVGGEIFQIAANTETTIGDLAERMLELLDRHNIHDVSVFNSEPRVGDVKRNYSDTSKAKEILGWTPSNSLDQGLEKTASFFLEQYRLGAI